MTEQLRRQVQDLLDSNGPVCADVGDVDPSLERDVPLSAFAVLDRGDVVDVVGRPSVKAKVDAASHSMPNISNRRASNLRLPQGRQRPSQLFPGSEWRPAASTTVLLTGP